MLDKTLRPHIRLYCRDLTTNNVTGWVSYRALFKYLNLPEEKYRSTVCDKLTNRSHKPLKQRYLFGYNAAELSDRIVLFPLAVCRYRLLLDAYIPRQQQRLEYDNMLYCAVQTCVPIKKLREWVHRIKDLPAGRFSLEVSHKRLGPNPALLAIVPPNIHPKVKWKIA